MVKLDISCSSIFSWMVVVASGSHLWIILCFLKHGDICSVKLIIFCFPILKEIYEAQGKPYIE